MKSRTRFELAASLSARAVCVALFTIALAVAAFAQESRGTIIGRVTDASGAVLPGIKVEINNTATNVTTTATTNDEGRFSTPFLLPGAYRVTAEKTGFKRFVQTGVEVRVSRWIGAALDVRYSQIKGILGNGGASQAFGENDLGGMSVSAKFVVGR